jgi:hypothetical protein
MATDDPEAIAKAVKQADPKALLAHASTEELARLKTAEEVLQLARDRRRNTSRWTVLSSSLVGIVAVGGMLINGYQSQINRDQQQDQSRSDQERWAKEFERAQRADKYRAFFETSVLATDPSNPDKRLVGYALLQEFVDDQDYNSKATLMLEESLMQELRTKAATGLDESHRSAVVAIVTALAQSKDCHDLERASRSIDKVAVHHAVAQDAQETSEIFKIYVRKLLGRASQVCKTMKDFTSVRRPLVEAFQLTPELGWALKKLPDPIANARVVQLLIDTCTEEITVSSMTDCKLIFERYNAFCSEPGVAANPDEAPACEAIAAVAKK